MAFLKEVLVVIWLTTELSLRVWSSGCRSRYQTFMGRLRFMKKPFCALGLYFFEMTKKIKEKFI